MTSAQDIVRVKITLDNVKAISDPHHLRYAELKGWLGRRDPNEIDVAALEAALSCFVKPVKKRTRPAAEKTGPGNL